MLLKKLFNQITTVAIVAGTTYAIATPALAQFYFPSSSFFIPLAGPYQSDEDIDLATLLEIYTQEEKEYTTLYSALEEADLLGTLEQQESLTVLAPSDKAFEALSPEIREKLSEPENLKKVLQYHLVEGEIGQEDIQRQAVATLLEDNEVKIIGVPEGNEIGVKFNEAKASKPSGAENGVIVPIDQVLIPPNL